MSKNITALLQAIVTGEPPDSGKQNDVYYFDAAAPILKDFVLHVPKGTTPETLKEMLSRSTALTPVQPLLSQIQVGQPLMQLGDTGIRIAKRQHGISLAQWEADTAAEIEKMHPPHNEQDDWDNEYRTDIAYHELLLKMNAHGNPFVKIFDESYRMGMFGFKADHYKGNVFVDTQRNCLHLIDQIDAPFESLPPHEQAKANLAWMELRYNPNPLIPTGSKGDPKLASHCRELHRQVSALVQSAADEVEKRYAQTTPSSPVFASVDTVRAVALTDTPKNLETELKKLVKLTEGQQR